MFDSLNVQNISNFCIEKRAPQKIIAFPFFLKSHYFALCDPIDINVGVFCESSVGFPKSVVLEHFPKFSQNICQFECQKYSKSF